jgi:predicted membrane-bound spermidine synthase
MSLRPWLFVFFVVSGFCSLLCQVVWLRLAMAGFGVTSPVISLVLSVFMGGLALGSWSAGAWVRRRSPGPGGALAAYGFAELLIALSAFAVPPALRLGRHVLAVLGAGEWGTGLYHVGVALCLGLLLLPFCAAMGATFPLALQALRKAEPGAEARGFSRLYLGNVIGATLGTVLSALVLIELAGFSGTLRVGALCNAGLGLAALLLASKWRGATDPTAAAAPAAGGDRPTGDHRRLLAVLFVTGFISLGMEVLWIRLLTPYLGNLVYSFAIILAVYLSTTFAGAALYRRSRRLSRGTAVDGLGPWVILALLALLPIVLADPRLPVPWGFGGGALRTLLGIGPFCLALGALTPMIVDRLTGGDPERTGRAYAVNVVGGILGPLLAGFALAPRLPEELALLLLGALPLGFALWPGAERPIRGRAPAAVAVSAALVVGVATVALAKSFEQTFDGAVVRRDHTATVAAISDDGKRLLVNGVGMTVLTPITKMMTHLPMALLEHRPRRGLVICFGMGTSFRSMRRWGIDTTAVELVPSVPELFGEFHRDGPALLASEGARVVIDDGRRFLEYDDGTYDVIVIDPPPPISAAGSSLLYSVEFYRAARRRLAPGGILQQWIPAAEPEVLAAMGRAFEESFPHRVAFRGIDGWGWHLLGSDREIRPVPPVRLAERMPKPARADLVEWGPEPLPREMFARVLDRQVPFARLRARAPAEPALTDERPINEYFAFRQLLRRLEGAGDRPPSP